MPVIWKYKLNDKICVIFASGYRLWAIMTFFVYYNLKKNTQNQAVQHRFYTYNIICVSWPDDILVSYFNILFDQFYRIASSIIIW